MSGERRLHSCTYDNHRFTLKADFIAKSMFLQPLASQPSGRVGCLVLVIR